ncbi:hypothetical protein M9458_008642, partial [Cirrhinus mrigala]
KRKKPSLTVIILRSHILPVNISSTGGNALNAHGLQFKSKPPQFQGIVPTVLKKGMQCNSFRKRSNNTPALGIDRARKDGGLRPILNLKKFNHHLKRLPFRMLCLSTLLTFIRQGDWFTTVDLQDAYFHIPIHKDHKKYLRFYFQGNAYEYNVLPFGLSLAPRTFTKCMDAALIPLRRQGLRIANYLDNWVICSPTEQQARSNTKVVLAHLQKLGLTLNSKKSCLTPTRVVTYLGLTLNSSIMRASLTPQRQSVLKECLSEFLKKEQVTVMLGRRLLGLMAAASQVVPL